MMKTFNLELAKAGQSVQTRDGRPTRIICYDRKSNDGLYPIVALVLIEEGREETIYYTKKGLYFNDSESSLDLFMYPTEKEGWVNIYPKENYVSYISNPYDTKEKALENRKEDCVDTIKINWKE